MGNFIKSIQVNLFNGIMNGQINFEQGLNIISGEDGTLKTKLLQHIRGNSHLAQFTDAQQPIRMQSISPKRNTERKNVDSILQYFRQQNTNLDSLINERQINDQTFENYPSLGDLYYVIYDELRKDGGNQKEKMIQATDEVNSVIQKIFVEYKLISEWDTPSKNPRFKLLKEGRNEVPLEGLSLGEQEILSLIVYLHASRNKYDIFLIDEPEAHLNWHLEEKLFDYLDEFCKQYQRQMIVVTHSRAIFKNKFLPKTQFFSWGDDGKVNWGRNLTKEQSRRIAGEAIEIIKLGDFSKTTFFVEDDSHQVVLEAIAKVLEAEIIVTVCENSSSVRTFFRQSKKDSGWETSFFLTDGDNEGNPFPNEEKFLHLEKYCIENYLLDYSVAALVAQRTEGEIQQIIFDAVKTNRHRILKKTHKFLEFLFDGLDSQDMLPERLDVLDVSTIFPEYLNRIGFNFSDYVQNYVEISYRQDKLISIFPTRLIEIIESARK